MDYLIIIYAVGIVLFLVAVLADRNTLYELNYSQLAIVFIVAFIWPIALLLWGLDSMNK